MAEKQNTSSLFDPPDGVTGEEAKYYAPRIAMALAGVSVHIMQGSLFVFFNVPNMILYNVFALILWITGGVLVRFRHPILGINLSFWEGFVHINTISFYYGLATGYHFFFSVGVVAPFLLFGPKHRHHAYVAVAGTIIGGLLLPFYAPNTLSPTLSQGAVSAFNILNIINLPGSLIFLAGISYYFRISTQRAEDAAEEARQQEAAANRAKSEFLANMSHEIRTPMNAILGYTQILNNDQTLGSDHRRSIETIGQSGHHLLGLINDVLDISKIEAGREILNATDFDLQDMLDGLGSMFAMRCQQKGLLWQLDKNVAINRVHGDEGKLRQILINLIGNAVKFTDSGSVILRVSPVPQDNDDPAVLFEVIDTGPGIPTEKQTVIFDPFQQEEAGIQHGGTGLGLTISLRYVEMMGGKIELDSSVTQKQGSRFYFTIPLPTGQASTTPTDTTDWSRVQYLAEKQTVHALIVDDVANNRDVLSQILSQIGITVQTAEHGQQALELIRQKMPDIIFMDIRMPILDGPTTLQHIVDEHGQNATKVIAATASVFSHQRQEYIDLGFNDFIDKPLRTEEVYACIAKQLNVTYQFSASETIPSLTDLSQVMLPKDLYNNLLTAIENHSITELRHYIGQIEQIDNTQAFTTQLRNAAQQFDMDSIKILLQNIKTI